MSNKPKIAILRWEQGDVPLGLKQLGNLKGNSTNPESYPFPVRLVEVKGANVETVITNPSEKLLADMIAISKKLEEEGIKAITTSCGFNAIFQKKIADAINVPFFSSSLMQVPFVKSIVGKNKTVAVITANKSALTEEHFKACGVEDMTGIKVIGLENCAEWSKIFDEPDVEFDIDSVTDEIVGTAKKCFIENPEIGAIVLECTDLPPYARRISEELDIPVFDFSSMIGHIAASIGEVTLY